MRWIISLILMACTFVSRAQDPNYFIIGKDELANTEVYTFLVADDGTLYAGTDQGLYFYRNGIFRPVKGPKEQQGNAIFGLKKDRLGQVYCCNLGGQIFKVSPSGLELYAQLPKSNVQAYLHFEFDSQNNLIVGAEGCYRFKDGTWETLDLGQRYTISYLGKLADGRIVLGSFSSLRKLYVIESNGVVKAYTPESLFKIQYKKNYGVIGMIPGKNAPIFSLIHEKAPHAYLSFSGGGGLIQKESITRNQLIQPDDNSFWIRNSQKGITRCWFDENGRIKKRQPYFQEEFIATIAKGPSGEYYFGTFGEGIKVVTNFDMETYEDGFKDDVFESLITSEEQTIIRGTRSGKTVTGFGEIEIDNEYYASIDRLFLPAKEGNYLFDNEYITSVVYKQLENNSIGNIKDVEVIDENSMLFCSSTGVFVYGEPLLGFEWERIKPGMVNHLKSFKFRSRSIEYDPEKKRIYVATYGELVYIDQNTSPKDLKFNGQSIVAYDMLLIGKQLWVGSYLNGVLVFEDGKLVHQFDKTNGLKSNLVRKLMHKNDQVFIKTSEGFQVIQLPSYKLLNFGRAEGFDVSSMKDFDIDNEHLWMLFKTGVQRIPLSKLHELSPILSFTTDSVKIGNEKVAEHRRISYDNDGLVIHFHYNGLPFESESSVQYRIRDISDQWMEVPITSGKINYGSIASGSHVLELRMRYRNMFGETQYHRFYKSPPFWKTWWFNLLVILFLASIIFGAYRYRLKGIRKKNQELLQRQREKSELTESQLRALRSQMNPHFIFNSLNAIQDLVLDEDTDSSYDYITLFAQLVRDILNYSDQQYIDISDEIKFLDTYLTLEKLRFKDEFDYSISSQTNQDIKVPSLLIQPFVENALLHGLLHKKGLKQLTIHFQLGEQLTCEITDNGIGRKRAKEIQERRGEHTSFALKAITERLKILNGENGKGTFEFVDLNDSDGNTGTKVIITVPYIKEA